MRRWLLYLIAHASAVCARYPLAIVAVLCFSSADRRHLTRLRWLETIDNDLGGDSGWREQHLAGADPLSRWNRIRWLWRNGGNAMNYTTLGVPDDPAWRAAVLAAAPVPAYLTRPDGSWLYRSFTRLGRRRLECFLGWALLGPQAGRCKLVFSIRAEQEGK